MFKLALIILIGFYILIKIGRFLSALGGRFQSRSSSYHKSTKSTDKPPHKKNQGRAKGGEYIDFEEIE